MWRGCSAEKLLCAKDSYKGDITFDVPVRSVIMAAYIMINTMMQMNYNAFISTSGGSFGHSIYELAGDECTN